MTIGTICTRETVTARKDDTIVTVAQLMRRHHVGDIVIVKEGEGENVPIGIVTDRDLVVEVLAQELSPDAVTVGDIMSYELVTALDSDGIWTTLQKMRIKGVRRMPVVNQRGGLVGVVSLDDVLGLLSEELSGLTKIVGREQERERSTRK
jgi:CBS domain-containing protein